MTAGRVFVFGTLKQGFPNFGSNAGVRLPGDFATVQRYPLYLVGERHSPWLVDAPGEGEYVLGQVFDVTPAALQRLDLLERIGEPDGYRRVEIDVRPQGAAAAAAQRVHAYLKPARQLAGAMIMAGPLPEYTLAHAGLYRRRSAA